MRPPCYVLICGGSSYDPCSYWYEILKVADTYKEAQELHAAHWGE